MKLEKKKELSVSDFVDRHFRLEVNVNIRHVNLVLRDINNKGPTIFSHPREMLLSH